MVAFGTNRLCMFQAGRCGRAWCQPEGVRYTFSHLKVRSQILHAVRDLPARLQEPIPQFAHCYLRRSALRAALDAEPPPAPGLPVRPTLRHFVAAASAVSSDNVLVPGTVAHDPSK